MSQEGRKRQKKRRSGQIVPKGERKQLIRIFLGYDATGKRRYHNKTFRGTKTEAQTWLNAALVRIEKGEPIEAHPITVDEYLDKWLHQAVQKRVREQTFHSYKDLLARHIRPAIGKQRLSDISALTLQTVYSKMLDAGLSARTVRYCHAVVSSAFKQAEKWGILEKDISRLVELPKQERRKKTVLSQEQTALFLQAVNEGPLGVVFNFAISTGMRPEEYLALQWDDIDFHRGIVTVQRVIVWRRGGGWHFQDPKTEQSRRAVPIGAALQAMLREHKKNQLEERLRAGNLWEDHGLVFSSETGSPIETGNLRRRHFKPALDRAGLDPRIRLYDLRHTMATLLLKGNVHPKIVSERLGHSTIKMTLDTYSEVLPNMQKVAVDQLEEMLYSGHSHTTRTPKEKNG